MATNFPEILYVPLGSWVLYFYYIALCVPMIIIVPFVAFRSLSGEREDGTFDLISITTLRPRQIVAGKLSSAVMQMLMYLSALAPAMAFTYMLRGIDIMIIVMSVFYVFLASVALSVLGLVLATVTTSRQWQMVLGVIYILALVVLFIVALVLGGFGIFEGAIAYDEPLFWAGHLLAITITLGYTVLFYLAAMARITFASDNRSTKIRIWLVAMQAIGLGWACFFWLMEQQDDALVIFFIWAGFHWWLMGALMVGESSEISPRVRRQLPETLMGKSFFIWLYPRPRHRLHADGCLLRFPGGIRPFPRRGRLFRRCHSVLDHPGGVVCECQHRCANPGCHCRVGDHRRQRLGHLSAARSSHRRRAGLDVPVHGGRGWGQFCF